MKPSRPQPTAGFRKLILQGLGLLGVAALWQMASSLGHLSEHLFPSPWYLLQCWFGFVFGTGWKSPYAGQFWLHGTVSLLRVVRVFPWPRRWGFRREYFAPGCRFWRC